MKEVGRNSEKPHSRRLDLSHLAERLRQQSRKLTGQRLAVLQLLCGRVHPMSIKEIFSALAHGGCDLATVYRSMHLLEHMGMVQRFDFGDGVARFELLSEGHDGHHHHLVCTQCSEVVEIEQCGMRDIEEQIASRNGFKSVTHKLEFFGLCPDCQ